MNRITKYFILFGVIGVLMPSVVAQKDTSKKSNDEIVVDGTYNVMLGDANKIEVQPDLEPPLIPLPKFTYSFPTKQLDVPSVFKPYPAVSITTFPQTKIYGNYVRIGFGNYITPMGELYLHNTRNPNTRYGLSVKHISQQGRDFQDYSESSASLFGTRFYDQGNFSASLNYDRNRYNFYAYDKNVKDIKQQDAKQLFQNVDVKTSYRSNVKRDNQIKWGFDLDFYNFSANKVKENDFTFKALASGKIRSNTLEGEVIYDYTTVGDTSLYKRNFIHANPRYVIDRKLYHVEMGLNTTVANDTFKNRFYLFPVLSATYQLIPGKFTAFASLTGNLIKNNLRDFARENSFIDPYLEIANAFNNIVFTAGVRGQMTSRAGFALQFSQRKVSNLHYYLTDTSTFRKFVTLYQDETSVMNVKAELNIAVNDKIRVASVLNFYNYNLGDNNEEPWQRQNLDFRLNLSYNLGNKLYAYTEAYIIGKRFARIAYLPVQKLEMKPILDLNIGVEYRYTKKISTFLKVNNLTSNRYQRWYNYNVYGINGLLGISFSL